MVKSRVFRDDFGNRIIIENEGGKDKMYISSNNHETVKIIGFGGAIEKSLKSPSNGFPKKKTRKKAKKKRQWWE